MSTHTPIPWSLGGKATIKSAHADNGTLYIATIENNYARAANAEFIVRACNSHDDLVETAKLFKLTIQYEIRRSYAEGDDEGVRLKELSLAMVKSTIAKAEGRS